MVVEKGGVLYMTQNKDDAFLSIESKSVANDPNWEILLKDIRS